MLRLIIFYFLLLPVSLFAFTKNQIDSLTNAVITEKNDTIKIKALIRICNFYKNSDNEKAIEYGMQGLHIAEQINYTKRIAELSLLIGMIHEDKNNYKLAIKFYEKASLKFEEIGNNKLVAKCFSYIGILYFFQAKHTQSLDYYFKSLELYNKINDKQGEAYCLNNIGNVQLDLGVYPKALESFQKALTLSEKLNDPKGIATGYGNIGGIYLYQENFDKASEYYLKALQIFQKLNDKQAMAKCYNNLGNIYNSEKKFLIAIDYLKKALNICNDIENKHGTASCYINIGNNFREQGQYKISMDYFIKSLKIYKELDEKGWESVALNNISELFNKQGGFTDAITNASASLVLAQETGELVEQKNAYDNLAKAYNGLKSYKKAYEFHILYKQMNDSIFNTEKQDKLTKMEAIYQNEKKQKEIEILNKDKALQKIEIKQQKTQKYAFLIGFALMLIFAIVILFGYRKIRTQKFEIEEKNEELNQQNSEIAAQRDNLELLNVELGQRNEEISTQRDEIELQRDIVTQQKDKIEIIHEELTDSIRYAEKIQQAMLPDFTVIASGTQCSEAISDAIRSNCFVPRNDAQFESFILFKPKDIVSGDFYWIVDKGDTLMFAVADCTGHGVPGAFMSMLGISFLNEITATEKQMNPAEILNKLREYIIKALQQKGLSGEQKDGMDIAFCSYNKNNKIMQYAGANNPLYIVTENHSTKQYLLGNTNSLNKVTQAVVHENTDLYEIKANRMPVSIYEKMIPFSNNEIQLQNGDTIYLTSDGFQDQFGGTDGKKMRLKPLLETLIINNKQTLDFQKSILNTKLDEWMNSQTEKYEQTDDITVLGIRL